MSYDFATEIVNMRQVNENNEQWFNLTAKNEVDELV